MSKLRISSCRKGTHQTSTKCITDIGGIQNGLPWKHSTPEAIYNIENKIHEYYIDWDGGIDVVVGYGENGRKVLKTNVGNRNVSDYLLLIPEISGEVILFNDDMFKVKHVVNGSFSTTQQSPSVISLNQNQSGKISAEIEDETDSVKVCQDNNGDKKQLPTLKTLVAVMQALFEELGVNNIDATTKTEFIRFITGRHTGANEIKNTGLYRCRLNRLEDATVSDLEIAKTQFEKLGVVNITDKLSIIINSKKKNRDKKI